MSSPKTASARVRAGKSPLRAAIKAHSATAGVSESERAKALSADIDRALAHGRLDVLTEQALQAVMAAACKLYTAKVESGEAILPCAENRGISATDAMTTASGLLRSVNLAVFELGMWQSWTGR